MRELLWLIASGLVVQSLPAGGDRSWYDTLDKPGITPPSWLFGVVWPILYAMMAVAAVLVFRARSSGADVRGALMAFGVQLVLNLAWSPVFFGLRQIGWALVLILVLWALIVVTTVLFFRVSAVAGVLMAPYLLWVSFASVLNLLIWQLNR